MKIPMKLDPKSFEMIKNGTKTVEIRINDEKRRTLELGDEIEFSKLPDLMEKVIVTVVGLTKADSFVQLFDLVNPVLAGWPESTTSNKAATDMSRHYSLEEASSFGVVGIHVKL